MVYNIQLLRGVVALMVGVFHLLPMLADVTGHTVKIQFLAMGVDVFFVISGFVMVYTNPDMRQSPSVFWYNRIARIVPLYWIATAMIIGVALLGFSPSGLREFDLGDVVGSLLFVPVIRADGVYEPVLTVGWTLIYEMFFYLLFGFALLLGTIRQAVVAIAIVFVGLVLVGQVFGPFGFHLQYYMRAIVLEFVAGCLLGLWYLRIKDQPPAGPALIGWFAVAAGFLIPMLCEAALPGVNISHFDMRIVYLGLPSILILFGALWLELKGVRSTRPAWLLFGAASYALYLFHPLLMHGTVTAFEVVAQRIGLPQSAWVGIVAGLAALAVAVVVSIFIHLRIEKPITKALRSPPRILRLRKTG